MSNIKDLFTSGQVLKVYKNFQKNNYNEEDFTWILGSMCLLGKIDEAKLLSKNKKLDCEHYFFLALAYIRISDFETAKIYIRKLNKVPTKNKFFKYQIMAIYAYYQSRYKCCLNIVKRSRAESISLENSFWKILAIDLLGHTHVMMGEVHKGIYLLEEAHDLALSLNNKAFREATQVSILNYQSQYTSDPQALILKIERKLKSIARQDNYSEGSLTLSLAHLHMLVGHMEKAQKMLLHSQKIIFSSSNPRQKCKWFFEKGYFHYLEGKYDLTLDLLNEAGQLINHEFEIGLSLKILGLKRTLFSILNKETKEIDQVLINLTLKIGDPQAMNKLARLKLLPKEQTEDPLQSMFDDFFTNNNYSSLLDSGYFGVLRTQLINKSEHSQQSFFITDLWKNGLLIITPKLIYVKKTGVSTLLVNALLVLTLKKSISKEDLVQKIWGYQYDPIRHDTLLYGLIHRLREILGPLEKSLVGENHHYFFTHSFKHLELNPHQPKSTSESTRKSTKEKLEPVEKLQVGFQKEVNWNIRQHRVLNLMSSGQSFSVSEYAKLFNVTTMTALRDLRELHKAHKVKVYGKARATTYAF